MSDVCAVIVTYRPNPTVLKNVVAVRPQVQALVMVDNGSPEESLAPFEEASRELDFKLIRNRENLGIAAALNSGVQWARSNGFGWVALFDQDSTVTDGFIEAMLRTYEAHPQRNRVAVVTSSQIERGIGRIRFIPRHKDGGPLTAITSGSLLPVCIFGDCGWFEEDLFIDCVDNEYCLRARTRGYTIADCDQTVLLVNVGCSEEHYVFGKRLLATHHSARRRYYMTRNRLVVAARYWRRQPLWCYYALRAIILETFTILLYEEQRWKKLVNTGRGIGDALLGRMRKVIDL